VKLNVSHGPKMSVVKEFSNVFFEEWTDMPPNYDIDFVIE
jgi:hypothetical protein